jgi:L-Ala-D/L-Glu epimerase
VKITQVEAIPFAIPYLKPLKFASGEVHTAEHVLVRVHTDDGVVGVAEAPPRPFTYGETQAGIVAVIRQIFAPQVLGLTVLEREVAGARLARTVGNPAAKAAIDMAMWDALGRTLEVPVSELLGGFTDRMRVSHMLGFDDPAKMVAEAERMRDTYGIATFKVKVGRRPVSLDTAVVRALRDRFGDTVELYVDGNRGWTASESLRAMKEMADLDLLFAEELCPADDVLGRRWLVGRLDVPFVADESIPTAADVTREVLGGSATAISIKTARTGFTQSQRVHHLAEGLGLEVVVGNQIDGQLGTACAVAFGAAYQLTSRRAGELSNFLAPASASTSTPTNSPAIASTANRLPEVNQENDNDHFRDPGRARYRRRLRRLGDRTVPHRQVAVRGGQRHPQEAGRHARP